ncbi:MAG: hypothetical protein VYC38_11445 [Pseudomonadota bacterium]|nr:hypothetical protein [Pseudomonadota bacterium]
MTFASAILHFDSAVGLTTVNFSIAADVQQQRVSFRPANYPIDVSGAFARIGDVPLFLGMPEGRPISGSFGVVIFGFDHDTYPAFERGDYSGVKLYVFGRGLLGFEKTS